MLNKIRNHYNYFSKEELIIYSKQIILEQIGIHGQIRIKRSRVLVIGAGGLGCPVMFYLTLSGIGTIGILDYDIVELSNLNRQILYNKEDINKAKVNSAKKKLKQINKNCNIIEHKYKLNHQNSLEIISYYDIVIDTTDNFSTRYIIDDACYRLHKTYIYGAIDNFEGQIGIFNYKDGIRYKDLYKQELKLTNKNCNQRGIMGIYTAYIGNLQASEAMKVILGLNIKYNNFILISEMISNKLVKKKIYAYNKNIKQLKNIKKLKILNKLIKNSTKNIIIDVREKSDFEKKHIKKSINIPMYQLKLNKTIKFIKYCAYEKMLQIYCDTNNRSQTTSSILRKYTINHQIITKNKNDYLIN